ncbi:MAG: hypothetical protein JSR46_07980 [Verrucomicrobia bacterium]|nr:hypothetical protein [Verrucomicrobiota bacterium]
MYVENQPTSPGLPPSTEKTTSPTKPDKQELPAELTSLHEMFHEAGGAEGLSKGLEELSKPDPFTGAAQETPTAQPPSWSESKGANLPGDTLNRVTSLTGKAAKAEAKRLNAELKELEGKEQKASEAIERGNISNDAVSGKTLIQFIREKPEIRRTVGEKQLLKAFDSAPTDLENIQARKTEIHIQLSGLRGESKMDGLLKKRQEVLDKVENNTTNKDRAETALTSFKKQIENNPGLKKDLWVKEAMLKDEENALKQSLSELKGVEGQISRLQSYEKAKGIIATPFVAIRNLLR